MEVYNQITGQRLWLDNQKQRLSRMRRRIKAWADAINEFHDPGRTRLVMITLTYAPEHEWEKNQIRDYLRALRRYIPKDDFLAYAWVGELQQRGVPHYHIYLVVRAGTDVPRPDESGMWPYGMSRIETGRTPFYLVKYLGKEYQKEGDFPKGMRIFAVWIKKGLLPIWVMTRFMRSTLPGWLRQVIDSSKLVGIMMLGKNPKPAEGGGWEYKVPPERDVTGQGGHRLFFASPWVFTP